MDVSPYVYVIDNPMILIDPTGMFGVTYGAAGYSSVSQWADAKYEENERRNEERKEKSATKYPTAYIANAANIEVEQLNNILGFAAQIFFNNNIKGMIFKFVDLETAKQHEKTYEYQMFLALVQVKVPDGKVTDPGASHIFPDGRIGVFDRGRVDCFPYNGFTSWVNLDDSVIRDHKGNKDYAAGYVVAHELLHQMVAISAFYTEGNSFRYHFHRDEGGRLHLNMKGSQMAKHIPYGPSEKLREAEEILPFHMNILNRFK